MGKTTLQKSARTDSLRDRLFLTWLPTLFCALLLAYGALAPSSGRAAGAPSIPSTALWSNLTPAQKQALAPLAKDWNGMSPDRQQKWLAFSEKFQKMKPEDQQRAQQKMEVWAKLTPEQRLAARENYIRSNKLQPDQRAQKWQEYQQLSDQQKAQLAKHPDKKKLITNLPTPAESKEQKLQPLKTPKKAPTPPEAPLNPPAPVPVPATAAPASSPSTPN